MVLALLDIVLVNLALYLALLLRFEWQIPDYFLGNFYSLALAFALVYLGCFYFFGLYNRVWKYASIGELASIVGAVTAGAVINIAISYFAMSGDSLPFPRSVFLICWLLNVFLVGGSRLSWRLLRDKTVQPVSLDSGKPVLIIGAGDTGVLVAKELKRHYNGEIKLVGFVDDDPNKQNLQVLGLPVLGDRRDIPRLIDKYALEEIILAVPSAPGSVIREIVGLCQEKVRIKILPGVYDLVEENVTVSRIREVQPEDLLGRKPVKTDLEGIRKTLAKAVSISTKPLKLLMLKAVLTSRIRPST